ELATHILDFNADGRQPLVFQIAHDELLNTLFFHLGIAVDREVDHLGIKGDDLIETGAVRRLEHFALKHQVFASFFQLNANHVAQKRVDFLAQHIEILALHSKGIYVNSRGLIEREKAHIGTTWPQSGNNNRGTIPKRGCLNDGGVSHRYTADSHINDVFF